MKIQIPEINDERLEEILKAVKPVLRFIIDDRNKYEYVIASETDLFNCATLYYIKLPKDLRNEGYNSDPKPIEIAKGLKELATIDTYHTMSSRFNPSISEVVSQIPAGYLDDVIAFEVLHNFPVERVSEELKSFHKTQTILYKRE